jgi:hypothetical protein
MKLIEAAVIALANNHSTSWKTKVCYNGDKLFSHFLVGFNTRYEDVVSYPLPIDYFELVNCEEILKEPVNNFRQNMNTETILKL